ncbi:MAG TPA: GAF domain-containing protein [Ktedonosporobacter sp.]|jgi:two-component system sensor histidine kinase KdpD|nr:GAF domain-containing protein [Ktedonosporobacter sp.]
MTTHHIQQHAVNLSIASPLEIEHTARRLTAVREDFLNKGSLTLWTPRPLILDSWQRCRTLDVNPSQRCAPLAITREIQLMQLQEENALLIQAAQPVIKHLTQFLFDSGYVVVLSDAQGRLLLVLGDVAIRRRLARIDFIPGGNWSEAAAGTNAIGTALADEHIVQLMAAEHYCDGWQDLTCTAAPIRHPLTNAIIGILDVTGDYRLIRPFLTSFLAAAALEIKQRLYTLLPAPCRNKWQPDYYSPIIRRQVAAQINETNVMSEIYSPQRDEVSASNSPAKTRTSLNLDERRAYDAECLVTSAGIISASLDLHVTLEKVVEQTVHLLHAERAGVYLFDEQDEPTTLHHVSTQLSSHLERPDVIAALLNDGRAVALIQERGEPVVIDDTLVSPLLPATFGEQTAIRSLMLLPLVTARGVSGFISVSNLAPQPWHVGDIRLGLAFAAQSATAIENARLFEALQQHNRHIEALNAIAQILSTLPDPSQHLDLVLRRIIEIIQLDTGMILLLDDQDKMTLATQHMLSSTIQLDLEQYPLKTLYMLARRIIDVREPLMIYADDCSEPTTREALRLVGFYSLIVVPLTTGNTILGVMLIGNQHHDSHIKNDLKFFSTVGQQLGLALKNAQLLRSASEMEALREADRVKSGFLAAVSHDLRSPLTAIRASVESLLDADGIQSALGQQHLLRNIAGQANRLGQLVDQLLDLSRIEAGALALDCDWTELSVLIADTVAEFERLHYGCSIEQILDPNIPLYYIDPDRLLQVLWNLLENAYKYAPLGTPIKVEARLTPGREVVISVADRGPGIPKGEQEKIFQRFYRLERDQRAHTPGSGMGLAICRGIIEAHGGHIWVEDNEGGSIFLIALPPANPMDLEASEEQELAV